MMLRAAPAGERGPGAPVTGWGTFSNDVSCTCPPMSRMVSVAFAFISSHHLVEEATCDPPHAMTMLDRHQPIDLRAICNTSRIYRGHPQGAFFMPPPRATSTASLPLIHGYGITVIQDDRADWRFGSINHGLDNVVAPISAEDRQRPFRTSWAAAEFFRRYYGEGLPKPAGSP